MTDYNLERLRTERPNASLDLNTLVMTQRVTDRDAGASYLSELKAALLSTANFKQYFANPNYTIATTANIQVTSAEVALDQAGTYYVEAEVQIDYVAASIPANISIPIRLRRMNNTIGDLVGAVKTIKTRPVTTETSTLQIVTISGFIVTTANVIAATPVADIIGVTASMASGLTAGSIQVTAVAIRAFRMQG